MEGKIAILFFVGGYFSVIIVLTLFTLNQGISAVHYNSFSIFPMETKNISFYHPLFSYFYYLKPFLLFLNQISPFVIVHHLTSALCYYLYLNMSFLQTCFPPFFLERGMGGGAEGEGERES